MKRVLLLGANGQFGTDIGKVFLNSGIELTGLTRKEFDADKDNLYDKLNKFQDYHYLINCIAFHKTDQCEQNVEQSFKINSLLVLELSKFCTQNKITFIHISTDYVFDGYNKEPYTENDIPSPLNIYGISKLAGEYFVKAYTEKYFIFRVSSLFGSKQPDNPDTNFVKKMIDAAREGRALKVIDNQIMSPTYTMDAARAILTIIKKNVTEYGIYHGCNSGECSWFEFAKKIFELTGLKNNLTPVSYSEFHTRATRPQFCSMDNSKLSRFYQIRHWTQALEDYLKIRGYLKE